jgi:hypothetical protein
MEPAPVFSIIAAISTLLAAAGAQAQTPPPPAPVPYAIPFQLRPAAVGNVARLDTSIAVSDAAGTNTDVVSLLLVSYKVHPKVASLVRLGLVSHSPDSGESAVTLTNVALGATALLHAAGPWRVTGFLGVALPVGSGGGNDPSADDVAANRSGTWARSFMDNAMFAVNDLTIFPGVDVAYVSRRLTVQAEATVLQLLRVRGDEVQPDESKTNLTAGLSVGSWLLPFLSVGGEFRYQRWLSTPAAVEANDAMRANATVALGVRTKLDLGADVVARPGVSFALGLDDPLGAEDWRIVQVDVPVSF